MKYSKLFGKTLKDTPKDASLASHKLLYQAGFIRESTAGRYYLLPLGIRVQDKIRKLSKKKWIVLADRNHYTNTASQISLGRNQPYNICGF